MLRLTQSGQQKSTQFPHRNPVLCFLFEGNSESEFHQHCSATPEKRKREREICTCTIAGSVSSSSVRAVHLWYAFMLARSCIFQYYILYCQRQTFLHFGSHIAKYQVPHAFAGSLTQTPKCAEIGQDCRQHLPRSEQRLRNKAIGTNQQRNFRLAFHLPKKCCITQKKILICSSRSHFSFPPSPAYSVSEKAQPFASIASNVKYIYYIQYSILYVLIY